MPGEFFPEDILHLTGDELLTTADKRDLITATLPTLISAGYGTEKSIEFYRTAFLEAATTSIRDSVFRDIYRTVKVNMTSPDYPHPFDLIDPFAALPTGALPTAERNLSQNYLYYADIYNYNKTTQEISVSTFGIYTASPLPTLNAIQSAIFDTLTEQSDPDLSPTTIAAVVFRGGVRKAP